MSLNGTILVVEDSPDDEMLILRSLKNSRISNKIDIARDGAEALDYLLKRGAYESRGGGNPAVILLDIKLPKVDGLGVLKRVRENPATETLPVVMLTSSDEQEDVLKSYELGANSYVRKPVKFDEFAEAVKSLGLYWLLLNQPPP